MSPVEVEQEVQAVTFYSWMGTAGGPGEEHGCPSGQVIKISGGQFFRTDDNRKVGVPLKEARFHNGICVTADPETIKELKRIARAPGSCITEDREVFYNATMTPKQRANRAVAVARIEKEENRQLTEENSRLRKLLEEKSKETPARRRKVSPEVAA